MYVEGAAPGSGEGLESPPGQGLEPEVQAALDAVLAWPEQNPRNLYPDLTDQEYVELVLDVMIEAGLIEPEEQ